MVITRYPAAVPALAQPDVVHSMFTTSDCPPDCEHCPEHPAGPGVFAVLWDPFATDGLAQVCETCLSDAIHTAMADTRALPLGSGVRVHVEEWAPPAVVAA